MFEVLFGRPQAQQIGEFPARFQPYSRQRPSSLDAPVGAVYWRAEIACRFT